MTLSGLEFLGICVAGGLGSMARAALSAVLGPRLGAAQAVLVINAAGSFLIGVIFGAASGPTPDYTALFLAIGVLGGFTTVSTFALQIQELWQGAQRRQALMVALASVLLCPVLAFAGLWLMLGGSA